MAATTTTLWLAYQTNSTTKCRSRPAYKRTRACHQHRWMDGRTTVVDEGCSSPLSHQNRHGGGPARVNWTSSDLAVKITINVFIVVLWDRIFIWCRWRWWRGTAAPQVGQQWQHFRISGLLTDFLRFRGFDLGISISRDLGQRVGCCYRHLWLVTAVEDDLCWFNLRD